MKPQNLDVEKTRITENKQLTIKKDMTNARAVKVFISALTEKGYEFPAKFSEMKFIGICGFTGICTDDDCAEAMHKALDAGQVLSAAVSATLAALVSNEEREIEYAESLDGLKETEYFGECIYTEKGAIYHA